MILSVKSYKGRQYNVPRASAVNQKSLLLLIGHELDEVQLNALKYNAVDSFGTNATLTTMLRRLPEHKFDKVCELVAVGMTPHGAQQPVTIDDFQNNIFEYVSIVAELVRGNLEDFFTYTIGVLKSAKTTSNETTTNN